MSSVVIRLWEIFITWTTAPPARALCNAFPLFCNTFHSFYISFYFLLLRDKQNEARRNTFEPLETNNRPSHPSARVPIRSADISPSSAPSHYSDAPPTHLPPSPPPPPTTHISFPSHFKSSRTTYLLHKTEAISHLRLPLPHPPPAAPRLLSRYPLCASLTGRSCGLIGHLFAPPLPVGEIWEICGHARRCAVINWAWRERYEKIDKRFPSSHQISAAGWNSLSHHLSVCLSFLPIWYL